MKPGASGTTISKQIPDMKIHSALVLTCIVASGYFLSGCNDAPSGTSSNNARTSGSDSTGRHASALKVAFIYGDTVNVKYNFLIDAEKELEREGKLIDERIRKKYERAESRAAELQREAPTMGQLEMQEAQIEMQNLQIEIQEFQEKLARDFRNREIELQREYLDRVNAFLKEYNSDSKYDIILNFQPGGNLLWVSDSFDITDEVLSGLNKEYADELASAKDQEK
jgi:outer membrane protein